MLQSHRKQSGSMLTIALFVIVVMSLLAVAMLRITAKSGLSVAYEVQGQRAFLAAQTGLQVAANRLFPIGDSEDVTTCLVVNQTVPSVSSISGLNDCSFTIQCTDIDVDYNADGNPDKVFKIVSTGNCGTGSFITSRTLQAEARVAD